MDLAEALAEPLRLGVAVFGFRVPVGSEVVVLPAAKTGTNWGQAFVTAVVALLVGGLSFWNGRQGLGKQQAALDAAQSQQDRSLEHDREMRHKDAARTVLATTLAAVAQTVAALDAVKYAAPMRERVDQFEYLRDDPSSTTRHRPTSGHKHQEAELADIDAAFHMARGALDQQLVQLRLFFRDDSDLLAAFSEMTDRIDRAYLNWLDTFLDASGKPKRAKPLRLHHIQQQDATASAGAAAQHFGALARQYVQGATGAAQ